MLNNIKPNKYWTKERCHIEALKYEYKKDFRLNCISAYKISHNKKWITEICSHMKPLGNIMKRMVYAFEFSDNFVYIGLTYNFENRYQRHMLDNTTNKSIVFSHYKKTSLIPNYIKISDYIDIQDAQELEDITKNDYQKNGWFILNKAKTGRNIGSIGGNNIKWNFENCKKEALIYDKISNFRKKSIGAYKSSKRNGWFEEITSHIIQPKKKFIYPKEYWNNKDNCKTEALKYKSIKQFKKSSKNAYLISLENKWLDEIISHTINFNNKKDGYWNDIKVCEEQALKYSTRTNFKKNSSSAYNSALRNNWLDIICTHMIEYYGYWNNYEKCKIESSKYKNRTEFRKSIYSAYKYSLKNNWLDEFFPKQ